MYEYHWQVCYRHTELGGLLAHELALPSVLLALPLPWNTTILTMGSGGYLATVKFFNFFYYKNSLRTCGSDVARGTIPVPVRRRHPESQAGSDRRDS